MIALFTLSAAIANRWRGSGDDAIPKPIRYGAFAGVFSIWGFQFGIWAGINIMIWTYIATLIGHGRFMVMGRVNFRPINRGDNWPAWFPRKLGLNRDGWWFDAVAMAVTGVALMLPAALCSQPPVSVCLLLPLVGLLKPLAYEIAWRTYPADPIALGELLFGAAVGLALALTYQT